MSVNKYNLILEQAKEVNDEELNAFVKYCNAIKEAGRNFEIVLSLHIDTNVTGPIHGPTLKLGIDVNPLSPLDKSWQLYRDGSKFPKLVAWAAKQPEFQKQIEHAIERVRIEITEREMMVTRIIDLYLKPLMAENDRIKQELAQKSHGNRPKTRKS